MSVVQELSRIASNTRKKVLEISKDANKGHIGSALSICEIVVAILASSNGVGSGANDRTRIVLSKGHASLAFYAALSEFGVISEEDLSTYCKNGSSYGTHPDASQIGSDFMTGSLGQGIGFAVGCAIASKLQNRQTPTFVVLSDSELNEGSTWESLFLAGHRGLSSLVVVLDLNGQQALGKTKDVMRLDGIPETLHKVGWSISSVDGHNVEELRKVVAREADDGNNPLFVIAKTIAGKGVSFMEGKVEWHYLPQSDAQHHLALAEIRNQKELLESDK